MKPFNTKLILHNLQIGMKTSHQFIHNHQVHWENFISFEKQQLTFEALTTVLCNWKLQADIHASAN
ncbi:CLUMA_CG017924, isoform A [Clunio marinus]|uniref:CLUMA_CG017924, isoform A n=1 Tax=Clunio marinus TaxID=568069 RepID=A0A1J1IXJ4_9DIPT|nr:CLUMA_CG017924, isoform A [Clunio marinus]